MSSAQAHSAGHSHGARLATDPWVGRREELAVLHTELDQAARGRPRVVLVEGAPGMGKSALLARAARDTRARVARVRADVTERHVPYGLARHLARALAADTACEVPGELSAQGNHLLGLLGRPAVPRPTLLVVDDLHWSDPESADVLGYVLRRLTGERVLVLLALTLRDVDLDPPADRAPGARRLGRRRRMATVHDPTTELRLHGFDALETAELARALGRPVGARVASRLQEFTGGRLDHLTMVIADDRFTPTEDGPLPVPGAVADQVRDHLAELPAPSRRLVEALAVVGSTVPLAVAAATGEVDDAAPALEPLLRSGLVRWRPADPVSPLEIARPVLAAAIYQAIGPIRRRRLHGMAATETDTARAWEHRVAATDGTDLVLGAELEHEAETVLAQGDAARAALYLGWAADLATRRTDRERRLLRQVVLLPLRRLAEDRELRQRVERSRSSGLRDLARGLLRWHAARDPEGAAPLLARAREAAAGDSEPEWLAEAAGTALAELALSRLDARGAVAHADAVLAGGTAYDLCAVLRVTRAAIIGRALVDGPETALRTVALLRRSPMRSTLPPTRPALVIERALCHLLLGRFAEARDDAAEVLVDRGIDGADRLSALLVAAGAAIGSGRWTRAAALLEQARESGGERSRLDAVTAGLSAIVAGFQGETAAARSHLRCVIVDGRTRPESPVVAACARAGVALATGDEPALRAAAGLLPSARLGAAGAPELLLRATAATCGPILVEALLAADRTSDAETLLEHLVAVGPPGVALHRARLDGALAERAGDPEGAVRLYRDGLATERLPDEMPLVRALLAKALARLVPAEESRAVLEAARARLLALGALPLAALHRSAERDDIVSSPEASAPRLSEREEEVAALVAEGYTNHRIAARLFITDKTVEYHLRRLFIRLGLSSRHELRRWWEARNP